jgi:hypothetical protein
MVRQYHIENAIKPCDPPANIGSVKLKRQNGVVPGNL